MARSFKVTSENRERRLVTVKKIDGLNICKSVYQPGYWFETVFTEPTPVNDLSSKHFITSGKITDKAGLLPDRVAGWRTWEDTGIVPPGTIHREALEGCEIWCVWNDADPEGRVDHVTVVFLTAGQEYIVPNQSNMFSAFGLLSLNGQAIEDETPYVLTAGERTVLAENDTYFMHWPLSTSGG